MVAERVRWKVGVAGLVGLVLGAGIAACGAEEHFPVAPANVQQCRSFEQLMPNFVKAIDQGQTANLKRVIEKQLLKPLREGQPPPVNEVMRAIFSTLTRFANEPPERGAAAGQLCAAGDALSGVPLSEGNDLCELRRALQVLVHDGKGVEAIGLFTPQMQTILDDVTGTGQTCDGKKSRTAHYAVAEVIGGFCAQNATCRLRDVLDLVAAFADYFYTPEGRTLVGDLNDLANKPAILGLLDPSKLTEADTVAIARALIPAVRGADADAFEKAFSQLPLDDGVKAALRPLVDDLKKILLRPELMGPIRQGLACLTSADKNDEVVRLLYRVAIAEKCPEFALERLTSVLKGLQAVDTRGSLIFVAGAVARPVRSDDSAVDSAAQVCRTFFSSDIAPGEVMTNAQLVLPVVDQLVREGIINEAYCAGDTLVFGCTGGQPACR